MIKDEELTNNFSCLNRAKRDEMIFVLLARDEAAPDTIRMWVRERIERGKNKSTDVQILDALECARVMEIQRIEMLKF